jgi:glycosyltransferase involved in cell wall biosynthesis
MLATACRSRGAAVDVIRVPWDRLGTRNAITKLAAELRDTRSEWAVVQFTQLAWSRRGLAARVLLVLRTIRRLGTCVGFIVHDPECWGGSRLRDHIRRRLQVRLLRRVAFRANRVFVTVRPANLAWVVPGRAPIVLPVGSNIPPSAVSASMTVDSFTIGVFGVSDGARGVEERLLIGRMAIRASEVRPIRLLVFGRGGDSGMDEWASLGPCVDLEVHGVLATSEISTLLSSCQVLLCVRGEVSARRGTVVAGIAHSLPILGFRGPATGWPLTEAGCILVPPGDEASLSDALVHIVADDGVRNALAYKSATTYTRFFTWDRIADQFLGGLG